ncbi:hypothetical protein HJC23_013119 [Cyclotella cryptica]|uniref:Uncharacterized protein n=1 Tax=Cyclotella cryptica TaxID=29204 RepID=A0ABD3QNP2_9STRA|eukprot:CCRYP_003935-RA/>CCRYP_003935-RA protein AED:0.02 eAED:0.02 QI:326/1/1/1/0/0/2/450/783
MTFPMSGATSHHPDTARVSPGSSSTAKVVDAFIEASNPKNDFTIDSHHTTDYSSKLSSPGDEVSGADDIDNTTSNGELKMHKQQVPIDGSQPQPRPVLRQLSPSVAASAAASKFSYEPRPTERAYYQGLFNYVASFLSNGNSRGKKKDIILPPKLVASKLFLASNLPPDRLRLIWNMATAIVSTDGVGGCSGCATEEAVTPSSPLHEGNKKTASALAKNAARSHVSKISIRAGNSRTSTSMIVMTQPQFNTAIRLIQLFQNRSTATDHELKKVDKPKIPKGDSSQGAGAMMQGCLVMFDEDGLLPAYFEGVSGVIVAIPGTKNVQNNFPLRRRSMDDGLVGAMNIGSTKRLTVDAQMQVKTMNERRMKQVEQEVILLKNSVRSLEIEVRHLKAIIMKSAVNRRVSVVSSTDSKRGSDSANRVNDVPLHGRPVNKDATSKIAGNKPHITRADSLFPHEETNDEDEPNVDVESYWGKKEELEDQVSLPRSLQIKRAKARLAVKEVASFDPAINKDITPPNVSSNIPSVHPPAKHHSIPAQQKKQGPAQSQGPSNTQPTDFEPHGLKLSQSSAGSNSTNSRKAKLASFTPNVGQTSANNNSNTGGNRDACLPSNGFNIARSSRIFQPNHVGNGPAPRTRHDLAEASVYSEQTALVSNGYSNLRSSRITPHHVATSTAARSSHDPSPKFLNASRASIQHTHNSQKFASARPVNRLTRDSLAQSVRHIVRTKDGTTQIYSQKDGPRSTMALDLKPLEPAPSTTSGTMRIQENDMIKKKNKMTRRLSTG